MLCWLRFKKHGKKKLKRGKGTQWKELVAVAAESTIREKKAPGNKSHDHL
tara:strand:+ start:490 stop:639 length:150 start_codon:yes stop_codon:yes gene_type:complete